ncbi:MAG: hypothetical protein K2Q28_11725 [Hyphomicrobium sp.]|nr:hypothetical protein [Hyphomicrobium sp.]
MAADALPTPPVTPVAWPDVSAIFQDPAAMQSLAGKIFLGVAAMLVLAGLYRIMPRVWKAIENVFFTNWRLAVLGTTGIVLSLASGWTTWDGMRNFTNEPILSFMVTFGIQGVMLVVAWLIGESFATGMSQKSAAHSGSMPRAVQAVMGAVIGVMLFVAVAALFLFRDRITGTASASPVETGDGLLIMAVGLLVAALVTLNSASDMVKPYLQSTRVIVKNAMLWVMFLACMASSVFFSFDSRFNAIFPKEERVRAAELRAQNQVAGIIADIGQTLEMRRIQAADSLFKSDGWLAYEGELDKLAAASRGAEKLIEAFYVEQMEERRRGIAEQQERIATAESSQSGLAMKKTALTEEVARLEAERPALVADVQTKRSDLDARAKEVDAKRVEAMAEEKGVEGTLKVGRGQMYRQRQGELAKLQDYYKIGEQRVKDAQKRLDETSWRIDAIKRELAGIDGSLAKLKGEADTAQQRIAAATTPEQASASLPKVDPGRVLPEFESARVSFRQKPDAAGLTAVREQCTQLLSAMSSAPTTRERVAGIDCDPKRAQEAASLLLTLDAGAQVFSSTCVGGEKLNANTSADELLSFSRRCLADSGLPSADTDELRTKISFIELNRDDKAHNFVVSINAFQDGNRLAYLALGVAIAIDSLIFMSGLFGANAVRSPLSDVPSSKARTAEQLEGIIENALLPDIFDAARVTLQSMRPITNDRGFMAEVRPSRLDPQSAHRVLSVLNAGTTIHAVEYDHDEDRYLVRAELFEYLSGVSKKAFHANAQHATLAELEKTVSVALLPDIAHNIDIVLSHMHPINEKHGFMAEMKLAEIQDDGDKRIARQVLNAGSVHQRVQRADETGSHFFIHRDLYQTLARLRARTLFTSTAYRLDTGPHGDAPVFSGSLNSERPALEHRSTDNGKGKQEMSIAQMASSARADGDQRAIRDRLLMAMGIAPSAYRDLMRSGALPHANALALQLGRLCRQNLIGVHINSELQELSEELERAAQTLKHDTSSGDLIDSTVVELQAILPALLLQQGGRYQETLCKLIDSLERANGEGHLDHKEQQLLQRLKFHESTLSKISRSESTDWQRVALLIEDFADSADSGDYRSEPDQRRPN